MADKEQNFIVLCRNWVLHNFFTLLKHIGCTGNKLRKKTQEILALNTSTRHNCIHFDTCTTH
jgi:hypothetical protein